MDFVEQLKQYVTGPEDVELARDFIESKLNEAVQAYVFAGDSTFPATDLWWELRGLHHEKIITFKKGVLRGGPLSDFLRDSIEGRGNATRARMIEKGKPVREEAEKSGMDFTDAMHKHLSGAHAEEQLLS